MAKVTPQEFQEKHARRLKGSLEDMRRGIERVSVAPTQQAASKQEKMRAKLNEAIDNGVWANGLKKVTLEDWKSAMIDKGLVRVSGGIDKAAPKVVDFASRLLPAVDAAAAKVKAMPDITIEDSIARMSTFAREMSKFHK